MQGESPRLSGRALVALATNPNAMTSRSGRVAVVAEVRLMSASVYFFLLRVVHFFYFV
jgi:hypothetical protein